MMVLLYIPVKSACLLACVYHFFIFHFSFSFDLRTDIHTHLVCLPSRRATNYDCAFCIYITYIHTLEVVGNVFVYLLTLLRKYGSVFE